MAYDVALLAEGVGRNYQNKNKAGRILGSPSSRRAWVEIRQSYVYSDGHVVALLAEGVGRNAYFQFLGHRRLCRPPRGGRG